MRRLFLSCLSLAATLFAVAPAPSYGGETGNTVVVTLSAGVGSLLPRSEYKVSLFNTPHVSEKMFTLRLTTPGAVSGCVEMSESEQTVKTQGSMVKIEVTDSELEDYREPRYSNYDCKVSNAVSFIDIPLDRDMLIESNTKKVILKSEEYGEFQPAEIDISKDRVHFIIQGENAIIEKHSLYFLPATAITLLAPQAHRDADITAALRDFGVAHGLTPLDEYFDDYTQDDHNKHQMTFNDPQGKWENHINGVDDRISVGHITATRHIQTAHGHDEDAYALDIYAMRPRHDK